MKPKEGTILTVAKGMSDRALELCDDTEDLVYFCEEVIKEGDRVLDLTPEMLPVLKQAGVVDSGGQGLMQVMKGAMHIVHSSLSCLTHRSHCSRRMSLSLI